jgi:hypothetical protein
LIVNALSALHRFSIAPAFRDQSSPISSLTSDESRTQGSEQRGDPAQQLGAEPDHARQLSHMNRTQSGSVSGEAETESWGETSRVGTDEMGRALRAPPCMPAAMRDRIE